MRQRVCKNHHNNHEELNKSFWIKNIIWVIIFSYFIVINISKPNDYIKYTWHFSIWIPLTSYIVFWKGRKYLRIYKKLMVGIMDMDTLIGLASHILYLFSIVMAIINWNMPIYSYEQMWEGPAILIIVTNIGHALENKIQNSTTEAYKKLDEMKNSKVVLIKNNKQIVSKALDLKIGDTICVKKGGLVPLDGIINKRSDFDYSNITGESNIITLKNKEEVISGSYNLGSAIKVTINKKPFESTLATLIDKIKNVAITKPKMQKLADKILRYFVPTVILISIFTTIFWIIINYTIGISLNWIDKNSVSWITSISTGVTVMAIACPCALGIATPLIYAVSSLLSAKNGIIINNPKSLEELSKINTFAFDKTGTITNNLFKVIEIKGDKSLIGVAKSLEKDIKHPIAETIMNLGGSLSPVKNIKHLDKKITGEWKGNKVEIKAFKSKSETTNIALYINKEAKLMFKLENIIKNGVYRTIKELKSKNIRTVMITGDQKHVALNIAKKSGINKVYYEISPSEKAKIIKKIQQESKVAFVGDGFNDSIAIKQANVSISFASGSDISNSLSDISILKNNFYSISNIIKISKMNNSSVKFALSYAFGFNMIAIPIAVIMMVQPWLGASIMAISDILVALNAFIYKKRGEKKLK